jgi:hypothetical protein
MDVVIYSRLFARCNVFCVRKTNFNSDATINILCTVMLKAMKNLLSILVGTVFFLLSCNKEKKETAITKPANTFNYVIAGNTDTSQINYYQFSPVKVLKFASQDSIDFNNDSIYEIVFNCTLGSFYCDAPGDCFPDPYFDFSVKLANNIQFIDTVEKYGGGYIDTLSLSDTINSKRNWSRHKQITFFHNGAYSQYGLWDNPRDHYVGFRIFQNTDTLYGWMKVNAATITESHDREVLIYGYGIMKK